MSQIMRERCHAITSERWAETPRRCKHMTLRSIYCHQHLKQLRKFRIMDPDGGSDYGLYTTEDIPKGRMICRYDGEKIVTDEAVDSPFILQVKKRPPTYIDATKTNQEHEGRWAQPAEKGERNNAELVEQNGRVYLYALSDIPKFDEILTKHEVATEPKRAVRIISKPTHRMLPKKSELTKQDRLDMKWQRYLTTRL